MMRKSRHTLRNGITMRIAATTITLLVVVSIFSLFIYKESSKKLMKSNLQAIAEELVLERVKSSDTFNHYIEEYYQNLFTVATFDLTEKHAIHITNYNKALELNNKSQTKIWSALTAKTDYFEITSNYAVYAVSKGETGEGINLLVAQNAEVFNKTIHSFEIQIIVFIIGISLVCALIARINANGISTPIEEATKSINEIKDNKYRGKLKKSNYLELNELNKSINHMIAEFNEMNELDKDLLANVSHEFKTPLTLIKSYAEMIQDFSGDDSELRNKHLSTIVSEADHLTLLVNDLLSLSRAQANLETMKSIFNLTSLVQTTLDNFNPYFEQQKISLLTELDEPIYIMANYKQICEVVYNYLANAINYAKSKIEVKLYSTHKHYRFEVTDDGPGIPQEEVDSIWDKYYRGKNQSPREVKGTGLGLAIVKQILVAHNYSFGVVTLNQQGSTFYFEVEKEHDV